MEELVRFTVLTRGHAEEFVDGYSELMSTAIKRDAAKDIASQSVA